MSKSCKGLLKELVKCLRESDCMLKVQGQGARAAAVLQGGQPPVVRSC